jgi:hypothetical protein
MLQRDRERHLLVAGTGRAVSPVVCRARRFATVFEFST